MRPTSSLDPDAFRVAMLRVSLRVAWASQVAFAVFCVLLDLAGELAVAPAGWVTAAMSCVSALGLLSRTAGPTFLLATLLIPVAVSAGMGLTLIGFTPSVILALGAVAILARLFRSAVLAWSVAVTTAVFIGAVGLLIGAEVLPPVLGAYRPEDPLSWVRVGVAFAGVTGLLAYCVATFVHRLDHHVQLQRDALHRLARDERERLRAEDALRRAEAEVFESQRREALARLAGGVVHDYSNQLVVILGWTDILANTREPETIEQGLRALEKAVRASVDFTRELQALPGVHVQRGRCCRPDRAIAADAATLRGVVPGNIELRLEPGETPYVELSDAHLARIVLNLVMNACDAMPDGGVLTVSTGRASASATPWPDRSVTEYAVITVADSGTGMDEGTRQRIFEPYFTTKRGRGTGLGLASVYGLVEQIGGRIEVASALGAGSMFVVHLPAADLADRAGAAQISSAPRVERTILLADDDDRVRDVMRRTLQRAGFRVLEAANAAAALDIARGAAKAIDLLCTDGIMPGLETRRLVEEFEKLHPGRPILICSGHLDAELLVRGIRAGDYAFLAKPFHARELVARVESLLADTAGRPR